MKIFRVTTSNGALWQIHDVWASTAARAVELAEGEGGANDASVLRAEERHAAAIGEEARGKYTACRVEEMTGTPDEAEESIFFCRAGSEG